MSHKRFMLTACLCVLLFLLMLLHILNRAYRDRTEFSSGCDRAEIRDDALYSQFTN
jgi:uncharacterized membrane protein YozB (DUF420 family)